MRDVPRKIISGTDGVHGNLAYVLDVTPETRAALGELRREHERATRRLRRIRWGFPLIFLALGAIGVLPSVLDAAGVLPAVLALSSDDALSLATLAVVPMCLFILSLAMATLPHGGPLGRIPRRALERFESAPGVTRVPGMDRTNPVPKSLSGADPAQVLFLAVHSRDHGAVEAVLGRMREEYEREQGRDVRTESARVDRLVDNLVSRANGSIADRPKGVRSRGLGRRLLHRRTSADRRPSQPK